MKQPSEFDGMGNGPVAPAPRLEPSAQIHPALRMTSDDFRLARRRLANADFVSDDFEVFRLQQRVALPEMPVLLKSDCLKYIAQLTLVKMRTTGGGEVSGKNIFNRHER